MFKYLNAKSSKGLADEGRGIKQQIESIGVPKMWGTAPPEIVDAVHALQKKCANAGLSQAPVFASLGKDPAHTSAAEVLLVVDELIMVLDPAGMVGG